LNSKWAPACPSALIPTFSWWAMVTLQPCHDWYGWGLRGEKTSRCDLRDPQLSGSLDTEGTCKYYLYSTGSKTSRSAHPIFFSPLNTLRYRPISGMGHVPVTCFWRGAHGWISCRLTMLELAADSWEASPGKGARYSSTNMSTSSSPKGGGNITLPI
jgi:hypothetical protein